MQLYFKKHKNTYVGLGVLIVVTAALLVFLMHLRDATLSVPFEYSRTGNSGTYVNAKMMEDHFWVYSDGRLGADETVASSLKFENNNGHILDLAILKGFVFITGNAVLAVNLLYLSTFFLIAGISFLVMRELKISAWIAICGSEIFAFLPYVFINGIEQINMMSYYCVPLTILICFWIYDNLVMTGSGWNVVKSKRSVIAILSTLLIAGNGSGYYQFFSALIIIFSGLASSVHRKSKWPAIKGVIFTALIAVFSLIYIVPAYLSKVYVGGTLSEEEIASRISNTEVYALKVVQLFVPTDGHGIKKIQNLIDGYNEHSIYINENVGSFIGIAGIIGFFILIIMIFIKKNDVLSERLGFLAKINIFIIFLATTGGLASIITIFSPSAITRYNRISVYIAFLCILAVALIINEMHRKHKKNWIMIPVVLISLLSILQQFSKNYIPEYNENYVNYIIDDDFIKSVEAELEPGAKVYQLATDMGEYNGYLGFLHSEKLRWSFGSGFSEKMIKITSLDKKIEKVKEAGYSAVLIDRRDYSDEEYDKLTDDLFAIFKNTPMTSENENLSVYIIN